MFHYQRHEDHKTITECVPVTHFIKHLIVHIPGKNFKMVRYYGIYAKHHKQEKNLRKCLSPQKRQYLSRLLDWRNSLLLAFGYEPLRCPECGTSMLVLEVYHKKTALFERYPKGYGIWIVPYALFLLYRQIVQPKPKTKYFIDNVMAKSHHSLFCYAIFYFQSIIHHLCRFAKFPIKLSCLTYLAPP